LPGERERERERELMHSFLSLATEFFATSHSTLNFSGNFSTSLYVGIIIIFEAKGRVDVLKKFSQALYWKLYNRLHMTTFIIMII
jgi:hypothetical protein